MPATGGSTAHSPGSTPADVARHAVPLGKRARERPSLCVGEAVVDDHFDGDAFAQRIPGFAMRRETALDARRVEQDGGARPLRVPQLRFHRQQRSGQCLARVRVDDLHVSTDEALAHRAREVDVEAELVARHFVGRRIDGDDPSGTDRLIARPSDRERFEVLEFECRPVAGGEGMVDEHGIRGAREPRIRRHETDGVAVDFVASSHRLRVVRARGRTNDFGGVDGDPTRPVGLRHGRQDVERSRRPTGQPQAVITEVGRPSEPQ